MSLSFSTVVDAAPDDVFAWHARPGAVRRLTPPWVPVTVVSEASSLRDGRAVLSVPGWWQWVAQHRPEGYRPAESFADELVSAPFGLVHWRHTHRFSAVPGGRTMVHDEVETNVPGAMVREMFAYRQRQLAGDLAAHAWASQLRPEPMTVALTGASGLVGTELAAFLTSGGHRVVRLVRRPAQGADERQWSPLAPEEGLLDGVDAVVHLAGKSVAGRFSEHHKQAVRDSRVGPTRRLAEVAARAFGDGRGPATFISASASGYYGFDRGDEVLTEDASQGNGFLADLVGEWEEATAPAAQAGLRVAQLRTGIVQSPRGGMLRLLYPLFFAGLGAKLGQGQQWTPWVGIDDLMDIYLRALVDDRLSGPLNAVAPGPVTNTEYTVTLARALRRPALFRVPRLVLTLVLGEQAAREFAFADQRVVPATLAAMGHHYRYPTLEGALRHVLGRARAHPQADDGTGAAGPGVMGAEGDAAPEAPARR